MRKPFDTLILLLLLSCITVSCATGGALGAESTYWIPPSAPQIAYFSASQNEPALLPSDTPLSFTSTPELPTPTSTLIPAETSTPVTTTSSPTETEDFISPTPAEPSPTPQVAVIKNAPILYYTQAADTLPVVAVRFGVTPSDISSSEPIPETDFIYPGQLLIIPPRLSNTTSSQKLMPDSEIVYSPSAVDFDASAFVNQAGGYLKDKLEWHKSTGMKTGAEVLERVAIENSINPRLLLALLEWHSHWVYGRPENPDQIKFPLGYIDPLHNQLYTQLIWTVNQLSIGYYAYREGRLTEIRFSDGASIRLAPDLNAGTAALQYYFAQLYSGQEWVDALNIETGFPALHARMFGNPWERAQTVEPLFPPGVAQPPLTLPFAPNWVWSLTGGPHGAWEQDGAFAALDFAAGANTPGCVESMAWVAAAASGLVVRTGPGLVVIDLDGDGKEQTGWVLVYLHVATKDRIPTGSWVATGDYLGHPSCEGGVSTGTHLHLARKFNGEWVPADGPLPFNLEGWIAHAGEAAYKGTLTRDGKTVVASTVSNAASFISRSVEEP